MSLPSPSIVYQGHDELGGEISLGCVTTNSSGVPTAPTAAPTMMVFTSAGVLVLTMAIPPHGEGRDSTIFGYLLFLGSAYAVGRYFVVYTWTVSAVAHVSMGYFDVHSGGNDDGQIISAKWLPVPGANYILYQTSDGALHKGRNPRFA